MRRQGSDTECSDLPVIPGPAAINRGAQKRVRARALVGDPAGSNPDGNTLRPVLQWRNSVPGGSMSTVQLFVDHGAQSQADAHGELIALVKWGVGGVQWEAEADFASGTFIRVPAEYLDVQARYESVDGTTWPNVLLGAFAVPGCCSSDKHPTRTLSGTIAPAGFQEFQVPRFAKRVVVHGTGAIFAATTTYNFFGGDDNGTRLLFSVVGSALGLLAGFNMVELPSNCLSVEVAVAGAAAATPRLQFVLDL